MYHNVKMFPPPPGTTHRTAKSVLLQKIVFCTEQPYRHKPPKTVTNRQKPPRTAKYTTAVPPQTATNRHKPPHTATDRHNIPQTDCLCFVCLRWRFMENHVMTITIGIIGSLRRASKPCITTAGLVMLQCASCVFRAPDAEEGR